MKRIVLTGLLAIVSAAGLLAQAPAGPKPKSKSEIEALQALQAALGDPDKTIAACENLLTKFADTEFKAVALFMEAQAYDKKKDYEHMVIFAERVLEVTPKDVQATLLLAKYYATSTRENDLDREEKLGKVEKLAKQAIEDCKTAPKPNSAIPDKDWDDAKKDFVAEAYNDVGLANLTRKKYADAAENFKSAVDANSRPEPAYMVRAASALQSAGKNDEAIVFCDRIAADPNAYPQIKSLAANVRALA